MDSDIYDKLVEGLAQLIDQHVALHRVDTLDVAIHAINCVAKYLDRYDSEDEQTKQQEGGN